jgi:hypothetical protein
LRSILPPSYEQRHGHAERVELAADRQLRSRNKVSYRLAHWPIWIWVFLIAPGPITFNLFAHGPDRGTMSWLLVVLAGTGLAGFFGKLPGVEPAPYILRFNEDRPNPWYRRICYTMAWSEVVSYALLNSIALIDAIAHGGVWRTRAIYDAGYLPIAGTIWLLGAIGYLPRVRRSTKGEGQERRYFYGSVWAVCVAQPTLWLLWKVLPHTVASDVAKLVIFWGILGFVGNLARKGLLPRTRPILPGELVMAD